MAKIQVTQDGKVLVTQNNGVLLGNEGGTPTIESLSITPMTSSQTIAATSGIDGYSPITVSAVTSSIDQNIIAENIKKDVQILDITGTLESGITPSGTLNVTQNGTYDVTNYASANINVSGGGGSEKYGATIETFLGDVDANGVLQDSNISTNLVFSNVVDVNSYVLEYRFSSNQNIQSVSFPDLTTLSHSNSLSHAFDGCKSITAVSFPSLTIISGTNALQYAFGSCSSLTSISFPVLVAIENSSAGTNNNACQYMISGSGVTSINFPSLVRMTGSSPAVSLCRNCSSLVEARFPVLTELSNSSFSLQQGFRNCTALTDIYFNSLTTTSFGSNNKNPFSGMMTGTGNKVTHTIHFPSNLESTISGLTGYPLFGGTSGYVVLAYDLPATS